MASVIIFEKENGNIQICIPTADSLSSNTINEIAVQSNPDLLTYYICDETEIAEIQNGTYSIESYSIVGGVVTLDSSKLSIIQSAELINGKITAKNEIDRIAELARLRYITEGAGQSMAYQEKSEEASDYVVAGYPADLTGYPWIQAEVNATGKNSTQAADDILTQKSAWISIGASIEQERLAGKIAVDAAVDITSVNAARDNAITALNLI